MTDKKERGRIKVRRREQSPPTTAGGLSQEVVERMVEAAVQRRMGEANAQIHRLRRASRAYEIILQDMASAVQIVSASTGTTRAKLDELTQNFDLLLTNVTKLEELGLNEVDPEHSTEVPNYFDGNPFDVPERSSAHPGEAISASEAMRRVAAVRHSRTRRPIDPEEPPPLWTPPVDVADDETDDLIGDISDAMDGNDTGLPSGLRRRQ